jgi:hypothetical protein
MQKYLSVVRSGIASKGEGVVYAPCIVSLFLFVNTVLDYLVVINRRVD